MDEKEKSSKVLPRKYQILEELQELNAKEPTPEVVDAKVACWYALQEELLQEREKNVADSEKNNASNREFWLNVVMTVVKLLEIASNIASPFLKGRVYLKLMAAGEKMMREQIITNDFVKNLFRISLKDLF